MDNSPYLEKPLRSEAQAELARLRRNLEHAVTAYDRRRVNRPGHNPYALQQYLRAVDQIIADVACGQSVADAIQAATNDRLCDALLRAAGAPL